MGSVRRRYFVLLKLTSYLIVLGLMTVLSAPSFAIDIPSSLDSTDRKETLKILGVGTSTKLLSDPYPLGGYPGFEVGVSLESIDTTQLSRLGDKTTKREDFRFARVSFGKGLYEDLDVYFHFAPFSESSAVSEYGGSLKWTFHQSYTLPFSISFYGHTNHIEINDEFRAQNFGAELIFAFHVKRFSLYVGGGSLKSQGVFMAGTRGGIVDSSDPAVDSDSQTAEVTIHPQHTFVGAAFHFYDLFAALQLDRYDQPVFSAKIGFRL